MELPQFIPQRSPVHIARLTKILSEDVLMVREHINKQDRLGVVSDSVTLGSKVLHVTKCSIASRVLVICGKPLVPHLLEPVRLIVGCVAIAYWNRTLGIKNYNVCLESRMMGRDQEGK